ncbi:uncharacterized protein [Miscanthus floridulus]|uniref:uncharacterized protein n=1 Tax=Miscanthus floridulus TaxID=154761 RepID=UPI0034593589
MAVTWQPSRRHRSWRCACLTCGLPSLSLFYLFLFPSPSFSPVLSPPSPAALHRPTRPAAHAVPYRAATLPALPAAHSAAPRPAPALVTLPGLSPARPTSRVSSRLPRLPVRPRAVAARRRAVPWPSTAPSTGRLPLARLPRLLPLAPPLMPGLGGAGGRVPPSRL